LDLHQQLKGNERHLRDLVTTAAPGLLEVHGVGPVTGAGLIVAWSHPGRVRDDAAFAALAGTCPIPASSGNTQRHRLNRGGDRQLNATIHAIAITRLAHDPRSRAYLARRQAEGKSKKEAIRCLKRYITREMHRTLKRTLIAA
jgi:transposase